MKRFAISVALAIFVAGFGYCCADILRVGEIEYLNDVEFLSRLTSFDYSGTEIVDIKTIYVDDNYGTGTELLVFLRAAIPEEGYPNFYEHDLAMYGPYFYEKLASVGVGRDDLISCSINYNLIERRTVWETVSTTQYIRIMPLNESFDGYSNLLIETYVVFSEVIIKDKAALLGLQ